MKQLKQKLADLDQTQILTRNQLKTITGGSAPGGGGPCDTSYCNVWNPATMRNDSKQCGYVAGRDGLPGFCTCPSGPNSCS